MNVMPTASAARLTWSTMLGWSLLLGLPGVGSAAIPQPAAVGVAGLASLMASHEAAGLGPSAGRADLGENEVTAPPPTVPSQPGTSGHITQTTNLDAVQQIGREEEERHADDMARIEVLNEEVERSRARLDTSPRPLGSRDESVYDMVPEDVAEVEQPLEPANPGKLCDEIVFSRGKSWRNPPGCVMPGDAYRLPDMVFAPATGAARFDALRPVMEDYLANDAKWRVEELQRSHVAGVPLGGLPELPPAVPTWLPPTPLHAPSLPAAPSVEVDAMERNDALVVLGPDGRIEDEVVDRIVDVAEDVSGSHVATNLKFFWRFSDQLRAECVERPLERVFSDGEGSMCDVPAIWNRAWNDVLVEDYAPEWLVRLCGLLPCS